MVAEISAASREQSVGIEQVNQAVIQMDQVTQQNAALVEEAAAAAAALDEQARELKRAINFFHLGKAGADPAPPSVTESLPPARSNTMALGHHGGPGGTASPRAGRPASPRGGDPGPSQRERDRSGRIFDHQDDDWSEF